MNPDNSSNTREKIVEAATTVFSAKGYSKARVSDIVNSAGVAQGTFYLYFSSKEECFKSILIQWLDETTGLITALMRSDTPPTLHSLFMLIIDKAFSSKELARIFFRDLLDSKQDMQELFDRFRLQFRAAIRSIVLRTLKTPREECDAVVETLALAVRECIEDHVGQQGMTASAAYEEMRKKLGENYFVG